MPDGDGPDGSPPSERVPVDELWLTLAAMRERIDLAWQVQRLRWALERVRDDLLKLEKN